MFFSFLPKGTRMIDRRFDEFLRRGGEAPRFHDLPVEIKFNPYHDPDDGRFTFGPGGGTLAPRASRTEGAGMATWVKVPTPGRLAVRRPPPAPTPKPTPSVAPQSRDHSGLSARHETGSKFNPGAVSTGVGDKGGGVSYGSFQIATKTGTAAQFIASPDARRWTHEFRGLTPGTEVFSQKWKEIAAKEPQLFHNAQKTFVSRTNYQPVAEKIAVRTGLNLDTRTEALRQVAFATSIQHGAGGGTGIVAAAVARTDSVYPRTDSRYEKALIENIYDLRIQHFVRKRDRELAKHLKKDADSSNNIATRRLPAERSDALRLLSGG